MGNCNKTWRRTEGRAGFPTYPPTSSLPPLVPFTHRLLGCSCRAGNALDQLIRWEGGAGELESWCSNLVLQMFRGLVCSPGLAAYMWHAGLLAVVEDWLERWARTRDGSS